MAEQLVIGAGLSGMVAAILLARKGFRVRVLEKYKTVGGQPERWPAIDVTPMIPERLSAYIGIPIGEPQVKPCRHLHGYFWGSRMFDVPLEGSNLCCIERGPRKTALDGYLKDIAEGEGVKFEFEEPVIGQGAIAALPPDTVIATGLYAESFDALRIPYQMGWCFGAKGHSDRDAQAAIYFSYYTNDYAYWACLNGVWSILFFTRGPIPKGNLEKFEEEARATEGLEVEEWLSGYGPTPTAKLTNPRLFASDKILAGTISGMIDPFALFGVHGALCSGRVAAMAVEDRSAGYEEYRRCLYAWKRMLLNRKLYDRVGHGGRRVAVMAMNETLDRLPPWLSGKILGASMFQAVPGYRRVRTISELELEKLPD